ncbi:unnamed protein product [Protopolystoma xenopodis]|uniref:Uncharacterized protein n=1 Tax=Protopolystoma xenopodis TaxID=117903 RepID=A0A448XL05_9PLAT|nr:unnamed protein product [Protopolystoma xenopodis]
MHTSQPSRNGAPCYLNCMRTERARLGWSADLVIQLFPLPAQSSSVSVRPVCPVFW